MTGTNIGYYERRIKLYELENTAGENRAEYEIKMLDIYNSLWYDYLTELRYNPYHDPSNGRFTSGGGGGGASGEYIMMVPKGAKGNGILVKDVGLTDNKAANEYYNAVYANSNINNGRHNLVNGVNQQNSTSYISGEGNKFGVSGGAGTAYTIVSTAEGNRLVRNDYISYTSDGILSISNKSMSAPRDTAALQSKLADISNSTHSENPVSIAGVTKGNAMTFDQANSGNANPNFGKSQAYARNCQTCVPVFMARQKGYNIEAKARNSDAETTMKLLSHDTTLAYIDAKTGKPPVTSNITLSNSGSDLDALVGQGQTYAVQFSRSKGNYGHIITASRTDNNEIRLYDPQPSKSVIGANQINNYFKNNQASKIEVYRIDNLDFNEKVMNEISKPSFS